MQTRTADGRALRALREEEWMTQKELAEASGVARSTIVDIEMGHNLHPRKATLFALADALQINPNQLLEGADGKGPLEIARAFQNDLLEATGLKDLKNPENSGNPLAQDTQAASDACE